MKPLIICDTGHNSHGLQYVAKQLKELTNPHIWIIFGMVNDKDTDVVMRLMPQGERYHYVFTQPHTQRARSAQEMLEMWKTVQSQSSAISIEEPSEAIEYVLNKADETDAIFIGGSNYLVGDAISRFAH